MSDVLDDWNDFPKIGLITGDEKRFLSLNEAIPVWDSWGLDVEDTGEVLEADYSVRMMTDEEYLVFQNRVDQFSSNK